MKIKWIYLPFLLLVFLNQTVIATETEWTEKKLGKVSLKSVRAADKNRWSRAIKYGEQALKASEALDKPTDARYLHFLKNLNRYYDKTGRLQEVPTRVKKTYLQSKKYLGITHPTTKMSRTLYYKLHISNRNYMAAIPLVLENISVLNVGTDKDYKHHQYLKQLYSLYAMTGQLIKEERTLIEFIKLDKHLYGTTDRENTKIIQNLANNYCRQKKFKEFTELVKKHQLQFICKSHYTQTP